MACCGAVLDYSVVSGRKNKLPSVFIANKFNCEKLILDIATVAQNTSYQFYWNVHGAQEQVQDLDEILTNSYYQGSTRAN